MLIDQQHLNVPGDQVYVHLSHLNDTSSYEQLIFPQILFVVQLLIKNFIGGVFVFMSLRSIM